MNLEQRAYRGNSNIKMAGVQTEWTPELVKEYQRCSKDPMYFIEKYMKVLSLDDGMVPFKLYDYQRNLVEHYKNNRFSITLACRQSGKSITSVGYVLWESIFHSDKTIVILANKGDTAREMLSRYMLALENLPFFLQPGCKEYNKSTIAFENNTKVLARATSASSIRGMSASTIFIDEFAFIENAEEFYTSTYPVISAGKTTKVIITSTANGIGNPFYTIWQGAVNGTNEFKSFRVDWWDVPGRDEEWKKQTINNTSPQQFAQEFSNDFLGTGSTLISANHLMGLTAWEPEFESQGVKVYHNPAPDRNYVMTVDVAHGRGLDYSTFNIIDITSKPFKVVAVFRDNMMSPLLLPTVIERWSKAYNDAYVIVENNDQGALVCNILFYDLEYENMFLSSTVSAEGVGIRMDKKIKHTGCSNLKDLIEQKQLEIHDKNTIYELTTFAAKGKSFEAERGCHDDLVMNLVLFAWFTATPQFQESFDEDLKMLLFKEKMKAIEDEVMPFGHVYNAAEEMSQETSFDTYNSW